MEEQKEMGPWAMFNVKIKNDQGQMVERKASDNAELLQWLEMKEMTSSILRVDIDKAKGMSVAEAQARAFQQGWIQLKLFLQDSLGLIEKGVGGSEQPALGSDVSEPASGPVPDVSGPAPGPVPDVSGPVLDAPALDVSGPVTLPVESEIEMGDSVPSSTPDKGFFEGVKPKQESTDDKIVL